MASLFIGFLVEKYVACQGHRKSDFGMASFSNMSLLTTPCFKCKRGEKSQAILALLDGFENLYFEW